MPILWNSDLNIGIGVIDNQHMRIVDFINQLEDANLRHDRKSVGEVLDACIEYTISHFAFEENLLQEAGYKFLGPHKKVHELFTRRIDEYIERFKSGENVGMEVHALLGRWLINHIQHDDADYAAAVKENIIGVVKVRQKEKSWLKRFFR
jgi:hemerythrin